METLPRSQLRRRPDAAGVRRAGAARSSRRAATWRERRDCASLVEARGRARRGRRGRPAAAEGDDAGRSRARRESARAAVIVDYHMHLRDAEGRIAQTLDTVERFVETAAARGVDEIGFTEHVYYFRETRDAGISRTRPSVASTTSTSTVEAVLEAKRRGLPVKLGLEVDFVPERQARARGAARALSVGLPARIGALAGRAGGRPGAGRLGRASGWRRLAPLRRRARPARRERRGRLLAHPDLVKIFGRRPSRRLAELHARAAEAVAAGGVASRSRPRGCASRSVSCTRIRASGGVRPARRRHHDRLRRARPKLVGRGLRPGAHACARGRVRDGDGVRGPTGRREPLG